MGVKGLWKHLCANGVRFKIMRLSETNKKQLVCDLLAIFYWLVEGQYTAMLNSGKYSKYTAIHGGDFNHYRRRVLGFIEALRHIGIEPIFFMDGPIICEGGPKRLGPKQETLIARYEKNLQCINTYAKICNYDRMTEVKYEKRIKKMLLFSELTQALRDVHVDIITCTGQADGFMAQYTREHSDMVCGILTNDTDLALMVGCPMIHIKVFDFHNDLKMSNENIDVHPKEITCKVLTSEILARHFGISERCLPALSILCGNDFTRLLNEFAYVSEDFGHPMVETVASFVKHYQDACTSPETFLQIQKVKDICTFLWGNCYASAARFSYMFYRADMMQIIIPSPPIIPNVIELDDDSQLMEDEPNPAHSITLATKQEPAADTHRELYLRRTKDDHFLLSVRNGLVWRNEVEQLDTTRPCIYTTTQPIRKLIYQLMQAPSEVIEIGQTELKFCRRFITVHPIADPGILTALQSLSYQDKLYFVYYALSKSEIPHDLTVPSGFDPTIHATLTCACVMYARTHDLVPDDEYFEPLLLACFSCALNRSPPPTPSRPGPTGVTIAAQFMTVLQHARWLVSLVGLNDRQDLPLPSSIFQPFVYIPLHDVAFRMKQKLKFRGEKEETLKGYYDSLARERSFTDFKRYICSSGRHVEYDSAGFMDITRRFNKVKDKLELTAVPHPSMHHSSAASRPYAHTKPATSKGKRHSKK